MSVKVKICGVRTPAILDAAMDGGADYVGFVVFPRSPRHVELETAGPLAARAQGRVKTVVVLVDPDDVLVDRVTTLVKPDILQLHGTETPARLAEIKARSGLGIIKAIRVSGSADIEAVKDYPAADLILFDAKPAPAAGLPGGNGIAFDWSLLRGGASPAAFALSGGLNASNVAAAIALTRPSLIDVSSGVERAPGEKDARLVADFIAAAKGVDRRRAKAS